MGKVKIYKYYQNEKLSERCLECFFQQASFVKGTTMLCCYQKGVSLAVWFVQMIGKFQNLATACILTV